MRNVTRKFAVALGAVMMSATAASAQFNFVGRTDGCFFGAFNGTTTCAAGATASMGGLTFTGSTFNEPAIDGISSFNTALANLGNFTLSGTPEQYGSMTGTPNQFLLAITLSSPASASGAFTSILSGRVALEGSNVFIDFGNNEWQALGPASAQIDARITDLAIQVGTQNYVNGQLRGSVVPEPSTYLLLATGMGALGLVARRRRNNA